MCRATDVTGIALPVELPPVVVPVSKSPVFTDLATDRVLPNGEIAEKWERLAIGPRLKDGSYVIVAGADNDYSVTQNADTASSSTRTKTYSTKASCAISIPRGR